MIISLGSSIRELPLSTMLKASLVLHKSQPTCNEGARWSFGQPGERFSPRYAASSVLLRSAQVAELTFIAGDITDDTTLVSTIDYGSVPNLEASTAPSFAESLGIGPPPSVRTGSTLLSPGPVHHRFSPLV